MADINIRIEGKIGRITLNRPEALNALTYAMVLKIEDTLDAWINDDRVALILIDAIGDKAFCSGGDIQQMYDTAAAGDFEYGRKFWRDEYRMNAKLANFPKPYIALMQGFTMGGGVGVSCHGSHRVVCENSQIAMPECGIGLVPDVGGSMLLSQAPGRLGEYLGATGTRMKAGDAIYCGFADYYIPRADWAELTARLIKTGDYAQVDAMAQTPPVSTLEAQQTQIDMMFGGETVSDILNGFDDSPWCTAAAEALGRGCPLSVASSIALVHRVRGYTSIASVLKQEYRFTYRSASNGDFVEGIRAAIIDKDRNPKWKIPTLRDVRDVDVTNMLMPLGENDLNLEDTHMKIGFIGLG
ncbi:MAG: enoyl-CoA hydratase/isomerase family protein, partial [Rhodobacteraceae bacterium]|nr:enoyl-CoA hydratase/isomerase family protein [Paracoccaceae bacterium]